MSVWHSIVTAWFALVTALCLVSARPPVNLANMRIPKEMRKEVLNSEQVRSVERFVEATKNTGFFSHTDKTFAPYLAEHSRFFALFYAPFSESCNEFLEGYKTAAESLVEEGYAANFTAIDCMAYPLLCGYHGLSSFPPPVLLHFDLTRERQADSDKPYRKIPLPPRVNPRQFMRGLFLNLVGELDDPYQEWEKWDSNGEIVHLNLARTPTWETEHGDSIVVLFGAATTPEEQQQLANMSVELKKRGVDTIAINCEKHDETCVDTFKPHSFPAVYYKKGQTFWKGYRGDIDAAQIVEWATNVPQPEL